MATVHYENGAYHLHAELIDESNKQHKSNETTPSFIYETLANHLFNTTTKFEIYQVISTSKFPLELLHLHDEYTQQTTPPPQV